MKKLAAMILAFSMVLVCIPAINSLAEADVPAMPIVTNEADVAYTAGRATIVPGSVDVFVKPAENTVYYYRIGDSPINVDVYYQGVTDQPVGSYFYGSLVSGAYVMAIGGKSVNNITGVLLDPSGDHKITVPVSAGMPSVLRVIAYSGGVPSEVFTHAFSMENFFTSELVNGKLNTTIMTGSDRPLTVFTAIYKNGVLVKIMQDPALSHVELAIDVSDYPLGEYQYKVFCWDEVTFAPLFNAVSLE